MTLLAGRYELADLLDGQADPPAAADGGPTPSPTPEPTDPVAEVDALVAELSRDLDQDDAHVGEKGEDLREELEDILAEGDRRTQATEARKLMDEVEKWVEEGELDATLGSRALRALEDFVRAERDADWGEG